MRQLKIGIVMGATNEKGYQTFVQATNEPLFLEICTPVLFGSSSATEKAKKAVPLDDEQHILPTISIKDAKDALDGKVNIISGYEQRNESMSAAVKAFMNNYIDAIAIIPQDNKGFDYKAATEDSAMVIEADTNDLMTWTINGDVRVLNVNGMCDIPTVVKALRKDYLLIKPRIAVMSKDESLHESFKDLRDQGYMVFGPFDADKMVDEGAYKPYDCLIFPNNDKAVERLFASIPQSTTYHYISGMPMVMTAPTCNDNVSNLIQCIYAAIDITRARRKYRQATKSPLEKQWIPRGRDDFKLDLTKESVD